MSITLIYFSPTNTTRTILETIAKGMGKEIAREIDLTRPENRENLSDFTFEGPVLLGAPVYAGRLPEDAAQSLKALQGKDNPTVLVVVYGNREYDDALLELKDIATDRQFTPLAAAAFIGEHSFSSATLPIAPGRPDETDLEAAVSFGKTAGPLVDAPPASGALSVPGNFPYREGMAAKGVEFIRVTDDCDECGICLASCPREAIDGADRYATLADRCIFCCACIKACPNQARVMMDGPFMDTAKRLNENCSQRKEPEVFFAG